MSKRQGLINYLPLLIFIFCLLLFSPVQSQTPGIGITLTWSTDTYVPLGYPGKALPSRGSIIEVVANIDWPAGKQEINPQDLVYTWFLDDSIQEADSGQGKQVFRFNIGERITRDRLVKVKIKDTAGVLIVSSSYLPIKAYQPEIVLESKIPSWEFSANQEIKFTAQPYFFDIKDINELDYKWSLGGKIASQAGSDKPNIFILKIGQIAQSIKQDLKIWVENKNNPLQRTQTTAEITLVP